MEVVGALATEREQKSRGAGFETQRPTGESPAQPPLKAVRNRNDQIEGTAKVSQASTPDAAWLATAR